MRTEFLDLIENNQTLASGLLALSHLLEISENNDEAGSVVGLPELVRLLAQASQKQTKEMTFVFEYTEREGR